MRKVIPILAMWLCMVSISACINSKYKDSKENLEAIKEPVINYEQIAESIAISKDYRNIFFPENENILKDFILKEPDIGLRNKIFEDFVASEENTLTIDEYYSNTVTDIIDETIINKKDYENFIRENNAARKMVLNQKEDFSSTKVFNYSNSNENITILMKLKGNKIVDIDRYDNRGGK